MKKVFKVSVIILLIISLGANFVLYRTYNGVYNKEDSRKNSHLLYNLVPTEVLQVLNEDLEGKINEDTTLTEEFDSLLNQTFEQLSDIQEQLLEYSGGLEPETGYFWTPIGKQYTHNYFYTDNYPKHYAYKDIQKNFDGYFEEVKRITREKKSYAIIPKVILDKEQENFSKHLFTGMTVSEAVIAIEQFKTLMLLDKFRYQLNEIESDRK